MGIRRLSFTERRRRRLAKKVDRLDRLETRNTITEPISVTGLAINAMGGAVSLGFILPNQASNVLNGLRRPAGVAKQAGRPGDDPDRIPRQSAEAHTRPRDSTTNRCGWRLVRSRAGRHAAEARVHRPGERLADLEHRPGNRRCPWYRRPGTVQGSRRRGRPAAARRIERLGTGPGVSQGSDHPAHPAGIHACGQHRGRRLGCTARGGGECEQLGNGGRLGQYRRRGASNVSLIHAAAETSSGPGGQTGPGTGGLTFTPDGGPGSTSSGGAPLPGSTLIR